MTDKTNHLRVLLQAGKPSLATRIWSTWPIVIEAAGSTGNYDYVEFVGEYTPFSQSDLENMARAAELHGMSLMMKVDFQNRGYVAVRISKPPLHRFPALFAADGACPATA